ncbi:MAG: ribose ABC transporter ATP-binding protein [Cellulomonas sp. 73-92]|uniref:substrate-binding domain-containing protein n=1 Tax=Cellulomonas sp. 73-92 TaxID=1895740 RepID=UPI000925EED5|nr:substrate-binding domain-containing protein [Cellulomonas sp. 73-92]OJV75528.1 MAG: ribose ABC transporter ATP-binding protein [Cellulomonas sp. 73-92]
MKLRNPIIVAGLCAGALLLGACGAVNTGTAKAGSAASASSTGGIPKPASCSDATPYVAVALPNLTNPYYVAMKKGFEDAGQANKLKVEVQIANDDSANQLAQVQGMLQKKPCALALNAVKSEPGAAIVKAANDAGVPVFTVNVGIDETSLKSQGASIVQYLGADNAAGGKQVAEQLLKDAGADAKLTVGLVTAPDETPAVTRDKGFESGIASDANAKVVATVDGKVKPDVSLKATTEMLAGNPDINVIFASTGPAAYGALQALGSNSKVKVYGFCAADQPLTAQYPACVAQEPEVYGTKVIEQIRGWLNGTTPQAQVLESLKLFTVGQTPGAGEVG